MKFIPKEVYMQMPIKWTKIGWVEKSLLGVGFSLLGIAIVSIWLGTIFSMFVGGMCCVVAAICFVLPTLLHD